LKNSAATGTTKYLDSLNISNKYFVEYLRFCIQKRHTINEQLLPDHFQNIKKKNIILKDILRDKCYIFDSKLS